MKSIPTLLLLALSLPVFGQGQTRFVQTLSALTNSVPSTVNPYVTVGRPSPTASWGAPRTIRYDTNSTAPVDNGCVYPVSNGVGHWVADDCEAGVIKVEWFQAIGDNATDCTVAVNNALAAAASRNGTLVFQPGTYVITSTITNTGANMEGASWARTKLRWNGLGTGPMFRLGNGVSTVNSVTIRDIQFDGAGDVRPFDGRLVAYSKFQGCRFENAGVGEYAAKFTQSIGNRFVDCVFTGELEGTIGLAIYGYSANHITHCTFAWNQTGLLCDYGQQMVIDGACDFNNNTYGIRHLDNEYTDTFLLTGCFFEQNPCAIQIGQEVSTQMGGSPVVGTNRYGAFSLIGNEFSTGLSSTNRVVDIGNANHVTLMGNQFWSTLYVSSNASQVFLANNSYLNSPLGVGFKDVQAQTLVDLDSYGTLDTNKLSAGFLYLGPRGGTVQIKTGLDADSSANRGPMMVFAGDRTDDLVNAFPWAEVQARADNTNVSYFPGGSLVFRVHPEGAVGQTNALGTEVLELRASAISLKTNTTVSGNLTVTKTNSSVEVDTAGLTLNGTRKAHWTRGGEFNVLDYGAAADGSDDQAAVQNAIAAAQAAGGGTVYIPRGTYSLGSVLTVSDSVNILGDGAGATSLKRIGGDTNAIVRFQNCSSVDISELELDGNGVAQGVDTYLAAEFMMSRCVVKGFTQYGLKLGGVYMRAIGNRFRDATSTNAVGILNAMPGSGNWIAGNSFGTAAIAIRMDEPSNGLFIGPGNGFEDNLYGVLIPRFEAGIYGGVQDLTIQGNFFEACSISPLSIGWGPYTTNSYGHSAIKIAANAFAQSGNGPIYLDSIENLSVEDHRFGPVVRYGTNFTMLHLRNNTFTSATNKVIDYAALAGKVLDQDGVVFVNAGDPPNTNEFRRYMLSGSLGLAQSNPQARLDVLGTIRSTYGGPLPTNGTGVEIFYQDSPSLGVLNSLDRGASDYQPMQIGARYLVGANWQFIRWPVNTAAAMSNPPSSYGALWFTNVSGGTRVGLVVRSPDGTDTLLGSGAGSGVTGIYVGTNLVTHAILSADIAIGVNSATNFLMTLVDGAVDTNELSAAVHSWISGKAPLDSPNFTGTATFATSRVDTLVVTNFEGTIPATNIDAAIARLASPALTGVLNWTNATSLAIPSNNDPTTDAAGEIAMDRNNDFVEVYASTAGESRIIPTLQLCSVTIIDPDGVQSIKDAIPLLAVETAWAPFGITIKDIWIKIDAAASYSVTLEEWTDPTTWGSDIETVSTSSSTEAKDDGTLADASVAAGSIVFVDLPTTAANWLTVTFSYIINPGN